MIDEDLKALTMLAFELWESLPGCRVGEHISSIGALKSVNYVDCAPTSDYEKVTARLPV